MGNKKSKGSKANKEEAPHLFQEGDVKEWKTTMVGKGGAGKSSLCHRFIENRFIEEIDPTIEDILRKEIKMDGGSYSFQVLDTPLLEEYSTMSDQWIRFGDAFFFVYDICKTSSLTEVKWWYDKVVSVKGSKTFPFVLVGCKSDLEAQRQVTLSEAEELAQSMGGTKSVCFETSAKEGTGVERVFQEMIRLMVMAHVAMDIEEPQKK